MTRVWLCAGVLALSSAWAGAHMVITPWTPLFKGVEHALGTNFPDGTIPRLQVVNCVRIDLTDPDVQLFSTPRITNYLAESRETASLSVSNFVKQYGVQVAAVANFYTSVQGPDPNAEGIPCQVYGLAISAGQTVSVPDYGPDSNNRYVSLLFTTNKEAFMVLSNAPPGTNTAGIYTAVSGYYPVLTNGVVLGSALATLYPDDTIHNLHPRTIYGLSQDRRYLFMMVIDGRQPGYSESASDAESGMWLLALGGWDGVNMDGGGSAAMYKADCAGDPVPLGRSSYVPGFGYERRVGSHLGVFAPPVPSFIHNVATAPGSLTATITWSTWSNASSQVEYGTTTNYGTLTPLDTNLVTVHSVNLSGLSPLTRYFFRVLSLAEGDLHSAACHGKHFSTTNFAGGMIFPLTNAWKYTTGNLDGLNWQLPAHNDTGWSNGLAALWAHDGGSINSSTSGVPNLTTRMPLNPATAYPFPTYYFRTTFDYPAMLNGASLIFSNFLDDGAVFYLNGVEVYRLNMAAAPAVITNGSYALGITCPGGPNAGNASCPIVFTINGDLMTNLLAGTNHLAVEAHNAALMSRDVVFESALFYTLSPPPQLPPFFTNIVVLPGETTAVLTWTTLSNSTTEVLYGLTPLLGNSSSLDANPVSQHAVALTNLAPRTQYYYRLVSLAGTNELVFDGTFSTVPFHQPVLTFSNTWKFTTNNLDGVNWTAPEYDDTEWLGEGPALLHVEDNAAVGPRTTPLPEGSNGLPYPTYYFRTAFSVTNPVGGLALLVTNFIDDGAVFYLNGVEIQRVRMPTGPISYATYANACPLNNCEATKDVPDVFRLGGGWMTNVTTVGDNFLAVEVHQRNATSSDIVFGSMLGLVRATAGETALKVTASNGVTYISWPGEYLTLQYCTNLTEPGSWADLPGPGRSSPLGLTNSGGSSFYRLRD